MTDQQKRLFEVNPSKSVLYVTSDHMPFWDKHHAWNHANGLEDCNLKAITRDGKVKVLKPAEQISPEDALERNLNGKPQTKKPVETPLEDKTVSEVLEWAQEQDNLDDLKNALEIVETKGGKAHIQDRINELESGSENPEK